MKIKPIAIPVEKSFLIPLALFLTACSQDLYIEHTSKYVLRSEIENANYEIHKTGISGSQLDWITYVDDIDNFQISYPPDYPSGNPIFMEEMSIERVDIPCSSDRMGASEMHKVEANLFALWGRVDFFDVPNADAPLVGPPYCRPPLLEWEMHDDMTFKRLSNDAAYVLCAERGDETVIICVNQNKQDEEMAKKIFETFRWDN